MVPQVEADAETGGIRAAAASVPSVASARVLVVDDDAMVRAVVAGQMQELGYTVTQASDGLAALGRLDAGEPVDLLVTDLSMPGMNGLTLIDGARRRRPALPALLLTGYADANLQFDETHDRLTRLLRKPVMDDELAERAAALLSASMNGPAT